MGGLKGIILSVLVHFQKTIKEEKDKEKEPDKSHIHLTQHITWIKNTKNINPPKKIMNSRKMNVDSKVDCPQ